MWVHCAHVSSRISVCLSVCKSTCQFVYLCVLVCHLFLPDDVNKNCIFVYQVLRNAESLFLSGKGYTATVISVTNDETLELSLTGNILTRSAHIWELVCDIFSTNSTFIWFEVIFFQYIKVLNRIFWVYLRACSIWLIIDLRVYYWFEGLWVSELDCLLISKMWYYTCRM